MVVPITLTPSDPVSYDITIDTLPELTFDRKVAIVTNPTVSGLHLDYLLGRIVAPQAEVLTPLTVDSNVVGPQGLVSFRIS